MYITLHIKPTDTGVYSQNKLRINLHCLLLDSFCFHRKFFHYKVYWNRLQATSPQPFMTFTHKTQYSKLDSLLQSEMSQFYLLNVFNATTSAAPKLRKSQLMSKIVHESVGYKYFVYSLLSGSVAQVVSHSPPNPGVSSSRLDHSMWVSWWTKWIVGRFSHSKNFIPPFLHTPVMVRQALSAGTLAIHRHSMWGRHRISSLDSALCRTRVEDYYYLLYVFNHFVLFLLIRARNLEYQPISNGATQQAYIAYIYSCSSVTHRRTTSQTRTSIVHSIQNIRILL